MILGKIGACKGSKYEVGENKNNRRTGKYRIENFIKTQRIFNAIIIQWQNWLRFFHNIICCHIWFYLMLFIHFAYLLRKRKNINYLLQLFHL